MAAPMKNEGSRRAIRWLLVLRTVGPAFRRFTWWLRQLSGDAAYENYVRAYEKRAAAEASPPLFSRRDFYLEKVERQFSKPNRCC